MAAYVVVCHSASSTYTRDQKLMLCITINILKKNCNKGTVIFTWKQWKEWVSFSFSVVDFIQMVEWMSAVLLPTILVRSAPQSRPFSLFPCKITTSLSVCYSWNAHLTKMFTVLHSVPVHCMLSNNVILVPIVVFFSSQKRLHFEPFDLYSESKQSTLLDFLVFRICSPICNQKGFWGKKLQGMAWLVRNCAPRVATGK